MVKVGLLDLDISRTWCLVIKYHPVKISIAPDVGGSLCQNVLAHSLVNSPPQDSLFLLPSRVVGGYDIVALNNNEPTL